MLFGDLGRLDRDFALEETLVSTPIRRVACTSRLIRLGFELGVNTPVSQQPKGDSCKTGSRLNLQKATAIFLVFLVLHT